MKKFGVRASLFLALPITLVIVIVMRIVREMASAARMVRYDIQGEIEAAGHIWRTGSYEAEREHDQ
jgi:hypothetical protein